MYTLIINKTSKLKRYLFQLYFISLDEIEYNQIQIDSMRCFQNCLDYFHLENLQELINRSLSHERTKRRNKIDPDRAAYSTLLDHMVSELESFRRDAENNGTVRSPALMDMELITPISNELINLTKRECNERSLLFQIIFTFYKQALIIMDISCQQTIKKALLEYFQNLQAHRKQSEQQINTLKNQLMQMRLQNDQKWKTFYMIVKDNRVLRRQKGKLMRTLQEQKQKLCRVHQEMMELAKQNQKNKLLVNYGNNPQSMSLFLKNTQAILKLDQFMKNYPKETKKMLNLDLKKLQVSENASLDEKIKFIIKTAKESQQIFDQYEDLIDTNQRPNRLIFNISTQTDPFDIGLDPSHFKVEQLKPLKKFGRNVQCQTHLTHLKIDLGVLMLTQTLTSMPESKIARRRKALKTNAIQDLQIVDAIKHFKQNVICKKVCNVKIISKNPNKQTQQFRSNIYNITVHQQAELQDFPTLATDHRLKNDIKRSKEFLRKQQERRSSRNSNSNRSSIDLQMMAIKQIQGKLDMSKIKIKDLFQEITDEIVTQQRHQTSQIKPILHKIEEVKQVKNSNSKFQQRYIINPPQTKKFTKKPIQTYKSFDNKKSPANISTTEQQKFNSTISFQNQNKNQKKTSIANKKSLKQIINKTYKRQNNENEIVQTTKTLILSQMQSERTRLQISHQGGRQIRKSGFAAYKKLNTVPNGIAIQEISNESTNKSPLQQAVLSEQQNAANLDINLQNERKESVSRQRSNYNIPYQDSRKSITRTKVINIFAFENNKLIDKIYKQIFIKRKQIAQSSLTLEAFLNSFIKTQYGSNQRAVINTHITPNKAVRCHPLFTIFDILLDKTLSNEYLQHLFKVFVKILIISGSDSLTYSYQNGKFIQDELFKIHFGEEKQKQISQNNTIFNQSMSLNICQSFLNLDYHLRKQLQCSQLSIFLKKLLPHSQASLTFEEIKEIFSLFLFEDKYKSHLITLRQYCNPQISIQNLCFYAIRQEWKPLLKIEDYITQNFEKYCLVKYELEETSCKSINIRYRWTQELIKEKQKNWNNQTYILRKYLSILEVNYILERYNPICGFLLDIQSQFSNLSLKRQFKSKPF